MNSRTEKHKSLQSLYSQITGKTHTNAPALKEEPEAWLVRRVNASIVR